MQPQYQRHLAVDGTFNIRDLGGYAIATGETRWRRVLRADGLHRLDHAGMAVLTAEGVTTIIDLRHGHELETQPNPFSTNPAVQYHHVSLFDQLAPSAMAGDDVLYDLYVQALTSRQGAIAQVLTVIANAPDGVVLFHCTAGKDRTGIVSALMLAVAGVETAIILEDYAMTKTRIAPMIDEILEGAATRGVDVETFMPLLACEPETMAATIAHVIGSYGSAEAYLETIGLAPQTIDRLRSRLVEDV
ncbi:tyrosine-protein phosphatase [Microvirga brassicacearum]|uniref:Tyrosine-protein phosphatase n=1 Tax=Microvirga brassicacearum TaxID=2580413 RepID=A0A5N3PE48_9HYPH|nr:tyrosine-protein phosphatase [Microvirga brassicacearum]KAB0268027.1 tyrosine-protein phosphatase [Microvirga brassicacearum]